MKVTYSGKPHSWEKLVELGVNLNHDAQNDEKYRIVEAQFFSGRCDIRVEFSNGRYIENHITPKFIRIVLDWAEDNGFEIDHFLSTPNGINVNVNLGETQC